MARSINRSNPFPALPKGGEPGQVLVKKDKPDGEADWDWGGGSGGGPPFDPTYLEEKDAEQDARLDDLEAIDPFDPTDLEEKDKEQDARLDEIEAEQIVQDEAIADNAADIAQNAGDIAANSKALADHEKDQHAHPILVSDQGTNLLPDEHGVARVGRLFRVFNQTPIGIEGTSSYKPVLNVYHYDGAEPGKRGLALEIHADGKIRRVVNLTAGLSSGQYVWKEALDKELANLDFDERITENAIDIAYLNSFTGMLGRWKAVDHRPFDDGEFRLVMGVTDSLSSAVQAEIFTRDLGGDQPGIDNAAVGDTLVLVGSAFGVRTAWKISGVMGSGGNVVYTLDPDSHVSWPPGLDWSWFRAQDHFGVAVEPAGLGGGAAEIDPFADYQWAGHHTWARTGQENSDADWRILGRSKSNTASTTEKLVAVYRNNSGSPDALNYYGKDDANQNVANVGRVKELIAPLSSEIDGLKDDLEDALTGAITQRSWNWVSTSAAGIEHGNFWCSTPSDWNRLTALRISDHDAGGREFPIDLINDGDVMEMTVISNGHQVGRGVMIIQSARVVTGSGKRASDITPAGWQVQEGRPPNQSGDSCLFSWSPSTNEYATEAYVDAKIAAIDIPDTTVINIEYVAEYMGMNSGAWGNTLSDKNKFSAYQPSNATTTSNWWGNMGQFRFTSNTGEVPKTLTTTTGIMTGEIIISETNANGGDIRWKGGASWGHTATVERWRDYMIWFKGGHKVYATGDQAVPGRDYHISVVGYPLRNPVR